jgi:hypothetical protein
VKTEEVMKNAPPRDPGNIQYTKHRTKIKITVK